MTEKHWHYKLMRHHDGTFAIHEMHPSFDGDRYTDRDPVTVTGKSIEDVKKSLLMMLNDIDRHGVVDYPEDENQ